MGLEMVIVDKRREKANEAEVMGIIGEVAGKDVIMLEEGGTYSDYQFDSPAERIFELYRNSGVTPIRGRPDIAFAEGCLWGGTTEINGGVFWRTPNPVLKHWKKNLKNTKEILSKK